MRETSRPVRQRIGRRLGVTPYYEIVEEASDRLGLIAQPERNRSAGRRIFFMGVLLLVLATILLISGAVAAGQGAGFGPVAITVALGGLFGGFGMQRIVGGRAVLSVRNRIDVTPERVLFVQQSAGFPEQTQELPAALITGARLRRRPLAVGALLRRVQPIVALELLAGDEIWIVDSAADAEALRPTAEALCRVLGIGMAQPAHTIGANSD